MIPAADVNRRPRPLEGGRVVYLAGPMRGYALYNFPAFYRAESLLRRTLGVAPVNPARHDVEVLKYSPTRPPTALELRAMFAWDLAQVKGADALVLLPGWRASEGANLERNVAMAHRVPRYELVGNRFLVPDRGLQPTERIQRTL